VAIDIAQNATVSTIGNYAPAVFAQSIGGGGGRVTNNTGVFLGTAGGTGTGGTINVTVEGTVETSGVGSAGIFAQSVGDSSSTSPINVTVGTTGAVYVAGSTGATVASGLAAAIYLDHGGQAENLNNIVINNGTVWAEDTGTTVIAVYSTGGYTSVFNNGRMNGDVLLTNNGGTGCFTNNQPGLYNSGATVSVGPCGFTNAGTFNVGSAGVIGKTTINGNYVQMAGGRLNIDADFSSGKSDTLTINGAATIAGVVDIVPSTLRKTTLTVLSSTGPLTYQPGLQSSTGMLFDYNVTTVGNSLQVTPEAHFVQQAASMDHVEQAVAANLQSVFDSGTAMDAGFKALSAVQGSGNYASSLHAMSGESLGAFGAFRVSSSRHFVQNLYGGCTELTSESDAKDSCTWVRAYGNSAHQDAGSDTVGYQADAYTVEIGGQVGLTDQLALVAAVGSEHSNFTGDDNTASITGSAAVGGIGLNYVNGPWQLSGTMDGAYGWYNSTRTVAVGQEIGVANAKPQQWQIGIHGDAGYELDLAGGLYLKPFVGAHGIRVSNEGFTEQGTSSFLLSVDGRSQTTWLADAGLELGTHLRILSTADFHPFISAAVETDRSSQWTTTARFADAAGAPTFDVRTAGPGTLGRFAIGADFSNSKHLSFSLLYTPEVGDGYTSEGGMARVSYRF
jgi:outer membrane autotransporter protein